MGTSKHLDQIESTTRQIITALSEGTVVGFETVRIHAGLDEQILKLKFEKSEFTILVKVRS